MSLLDRLERIFGRFAIPNLTLWLIIGQVFVLLAAMARLVDPNGLTLTPTDALANHQWWRLITFLFVPLYIPPPGTVSVWLLFLVFGWSVFYMFGTTLEGYWGTFRYNAFVLLGLALTVGFGFLRAHDGITYVYFAASVFLAFAYVNPDFELMVFLVVPVKVKWLALLGWIALVHEFVVNGEAVRLQIAAAVGNLLVFFGRDIVRTLQQGRRTMNRKAQRAAEAGEARHVCFVCGKTDLSHPNLDFRYCSKCAGDQCYCPEHIHNHQHVAAPATESSP